MKSQSADAPDVYEFLDAVAYLQAYYQFRKSLSRAFSYEIWSSELGFKSRSFLRMIVMGKKQIPPSLMTAFATNNFQDQKSRDYFEYLVKHSQAGNAKDRKLFGQKMIELLKIRSTSTQVENVDDFVSSPMLPRMLSLFSYSDFKATVENFSRILRLSEEDTLRSLGILETLGFTKRKKDLDEWESDVVTFTVPDQFGNYNLAKFHQESLNDAIKSLSEPKELRRFKALLLPMDREGLQVFNELLDRFSEEQMARYNTETCKGKRVFQANFNIFPISEEI